MVMRLHLLQRSKARPTAKGQTHAVRAKSTGFEGGETHFARDLEVLDRDSQGWDEGLRIDDAVLRLERGMSLEQAQAVFGPETAAKARVILRIRSGEPFELIEAATPKGALAHQVLAGDGD